MQYIPIAAVPMTNTRSPQTTLLHRGRKGEFNDRASSGKTTTRFCYCRHSWLKAQKQPTKSESFESLNPKHKFEHLGEMDGRQRGFMVEVSMFKQTAGVRGKD